METVAWPAPVFWAALKAQNPAGVLEAITAGGLWLTLVTAPLAAGGIVYWPGSNFSPHLYWFDAAMAVTLAAWAGCLWMRGEALLTVGHPWIAGGLAALLGLALAGVPFSVQPAVALGMTARLWFTVLFYLFLVNYRPRTLLVGSALLSSLVLQALVALGQVARQGSLGLEGLGEPRLNPATPGIAVIVVDGHRWLRAYGLTDHPNLLAGLAAVTGIFLAASLPRGLREGCIACMGIVLLGGLSRGAWLATGIGAICLGVNAGWRRPARRAGAAGPWRPLGALLIGVLALLPRLNPTNRLETQSLRAHFEEIGQALGLILHHPLLGVGANCYPIALGRVVSAITYAPYGVPIVHNSLLLAGAEMGVPAALL
ncbi:MAG: O-antigen ligase family protein, partial [Chloroflexota bacterium]